MNVEKIKFLLQSKKEEILDKTTKVFYKGEKHNFYFVDALFRTFSMMGFHCFFDDFVTALESTSDFLLFKSKNNKMSIVAERREVDREKIAGIIKSMENSEEKVSSTKEGSATFEELKGFDGKRMSYESASESSDLGPISKKFKTALELKEAKGKSTFSSFQALKEKIVNSFNENPVIPISSLNNAVVQKHGQGFSYKTQECEIFRHKHGSLKKFLLCCNSFLEVKTFKTCYVYLKTSEIREICNKRILTYLVPQGHPKFHCFMEILICNLFPIKVTIPFEDINFLFFDVYNKKLEAVLGQPVKKFLVNLKSPNLQLCHSNMNWTLSVVPLCDDSYSYWFDSNIYEEISTLENGLTDHPQPSLVKNVDSGQILLGDYLQVKDSQVNSDRNLIQLLELADMNIPKKLQNITIDKLDDTFLYTNVWRYLRENVNFDNKRCFF